MEPKQLNEMIINLVQQRRILYDPQYSKFFTHNETTMLRERAWLGIARKLGLSKKLCEITWQTLREDFVKALNNRCIVRVAGQSPFVLSTYKYEKQMDFLLPHLGISNSPQVIHYAKEKRKSDKNTLESHADPLSKKLRLSNNCTVEVVEIGSDSEEEQEDEEGEEGEGEGEEEEENNNNTNSTIEVDEIIENSNPTVPNSHQTTEEPNGELIVQLNGETFSIPTIYISEDEEEEKDKEDSSLYLNVRPAIENCNAVESSSAIPIELVSDNSESDSEVEITIPVNEIIGNLNIEKELGLELDSLDTSTSNEIIVVPKGEHSRRESASTSERPEEDDEEGEEYFYTALANSANNIRNYRERLLLRKEVTKVVMQAVTKYLASEIPSNNT